MARRTLGWVQNPGNIKALVFAVGALQKGSKENRILLESRLPLLLRFKLISQEDYDNFSTYLSSDCAEFPYAILKGKGSKGRRKDALCTGIIQACLTGQGSHIYIDDDGISEKIKKPYTDDWSADGYLRWGIATRLIDYDSAMDTCSVSELGRAIIAADAEKRKELLVQAFLSYPPLVRVLELLSDREAHTKFEIGSRLGFKGEKGFTSIPQSDFLYDCAMSSDKEELGKIKSNEEGDSDKYARMIVGWLVKLEMANSTKKVVSCTFENGNSYALPLPAWKITRLGEKALKESKGNSRHPRIPKIVSFEMLASNAALNANYLRLRRAHIIKSLEHGKTLASIQSQLMEHSIDENDTVIRDEIENLRNIGLNIEVNENNGKYMLRETIIGLELPKDCIAPKNDITTLKDSLRNQLKHLNHEYLLLIDLAYSDKPDKIKDARDFEIQTARLFTEELGFGGRHLGGANKPDSIIFYEDRGAIIDNKSYANGFSIDGHHRDEMSRYVEQNSKRTAKVPPNEWWKHFSSDVNQFWFLFITSYLTGNYQSQINYINTMRQVPGGALGIVSLLQTAELIKRGDMSKRDFFTSISQSSSDVRI